MRDRAPRITLCKLHNLDFSVNGERQTLSNVSSGGIGILNPTPSIGLVTPGMELNSTLKFKDRPEHQLKLKIAHVAPAFIGAQIIMPSDRFLSELKEYFVRELSIKKMKQIPKEMVKQSGKGINENTKTLIQNFLANLENLPSQHRQFILKYL